MASTCFLWCQNSDKIHNSNCVTNYRLRFELGSGAGFKLSTYFSAQQSSFFMHSYHLFPSNTFFHVVKEMEKNGYLIIKHLFVFFRLKKSVPSSPVCLKHQQQSYFHGQRWMTGVRSWQECQKKSLSTSVASRKAWHNDWREKDQIRFCSVRTRIWGYSGQDSPKPAWTGIIFLYDWMHCTAAKWLAD